MLQKSSECEPIGQAEVPSDVLRRSDGATTQERSVYDHT
jgi:hypothetical protein